MISLGSVTLTRVKDFGGWSYPQFGSLVKILSDGTTVDNEVLQTGAIPRAQASLSGLLSSYADVLTLHGYNASKEVVSFVENDASVDDTRDVNVLDFVVVRQRPWLWEYSLTIVDAG
jgi:hypothetical protein